jgi:short-subunit dehydrogenase
MKSLVLISGAAGGLGKAFAVECASRGWDLFLTDVHSEALEVLANSLRGTYGVDVQARMCDLADQSSRAEFFSELGGRRLHFWALINVAGVDFEGPFFEQSLPQLRTILRLNLEGTLEMTHAILGLRDPYRTLRIINVASLAAFSPMPVKATYAASKRFLLDFSQALGEEVRSLGVTVTALCPAGMPTTPENMEAITAQGWIGQVTTQDTGAVAAGTLDAALRGKRVYIPGALNQVIRLLSSLMPPSWSAYYINRRWTAARRKRPSLRPELAFRSR